MSISILKTQVDGVRSISALNTYVDGFPGLSPHIAYEQASGVIPRLMLYLPTSFFSIPIQKRIKYITAKCSYCILLFIFGERTV